MTSYLRNRGEFSNSDIDALETLVEIPVHEHENLWVEFVVGVADFSEFVVSFKIHPDGDYFAIASAAADYTAPEGPILGAQGDLTIAADGATVYWLSLDVKGVYMVKLAAAGTSSTTQGYWRLSSGTR